MPIQWEVRLERTVSLGMAIVDRVDNQTLVLAIASSFPQPSLFHLRQCLGLQTKPFYRPHLQKSNKNIRGAKDDTSHHCSRWGENYLRRQG
jgi:hypothetical protein